MHDGPLAILPYIWLTVNGFLTAAAFTLAVWYRVRGRQMLVGALTMTLIGLWFALIAITAGPTPTIPRGELADTLRIVAASAGPVWSLWLIMYARTLISIERRK